MTINSRMTRVAARRLDERVNLAAVRMLGFGGRLVPGEVRRQRQRRVTVTYEQLRDPRGVWAYKGVGSQTGRRAWSIRLIIASSAVTSTGFFRTATPGWEARGSPMIGEPVTMITGMWASR